MKSDAGGGFGPCRSRPDGVKIFAAACKLAGSTRASLPTSEKKPVRLAGAGKGARRDPQRGPGDGDVPGMLARGECWLLLDALGMLRGGCQRCRRRARAQPPAREQRPPPAWPKLGCGGLRAEGTLPEKPRGLSRHPPRGWVFAVRHLLSCSSGNPGAARSGTRASSCFWVIVGASVPGLCRVPSRCQPPAAGGVSGCSCLPQHRDGPADGPQAVAAWVTSRGGQHGLGVCPG